MLVHPSESTGDPQATGVEVRSVAERAVDAEITIVGVHTPTFLDAAAGGNGDGIDELRAISLGLLPRESLVL